MKKLTAGIFTVLLGLVAANSADAAVASKGYVDEMVGVNTTAIETLGGTVAGHTQSIADLTAADTAINARIGTVEEGKTVVDLIEAAKQEAIDGVASYDDTEVRGLIAEKENSSNKVNEIREWSDGEKAQYYPTVYLTEDMIATSTNDLTLSVSQNEAAIQNINNSAVMNSGITKDKVTAYDAYAGTISANTAAAADAQAAAEAAQDAAEANALEIAAINNSENGFLKQAETAAKSYADSLADNYDAAGSAATALTDAKAYADGLADNYDAAGAAEAAETAAKSYADGLAANYDAAGAAATAEAAAVATAKEYTDAQVKNVDDKLADYALKSTIGEVESGKTVVQMISEAKTAATYDDTEVKGLIATNKTATETNAAAIKAINEGTVMSSGITEGKVAAYDAYAGTIAANTAAAEAAQNAADAAQADADAAQQTANNAIPKPSGECADANNKCVLTFNNAQYAWEVIERAKGE